MCLCNFEWECGRDWEEFSLVKIACAVRRAATAYACLCFHIYTLFIAPLWKVGAILDLLVLPDFCGPVILSVRHSVIIQMKLEYLWGQVANVDQILYEVSLGWGKGCIRFRDKLDQNSGFHDNRKRPLTYNGETMSLPFLGCFWSDSFYTCR